ncbi:MAG TPA: DUF2397 domain-containing protein [Streptosporangiaceae bacterium]
MAHTRDDAVPAGTDAPVDVDRLRLYAYLSAREWRTYVAVMRLFTSTLLADLGANEVAAALAEAERAGEVEPGESAIDTVVDRLRQLASWGNLLPGRREPAATIADFTRSRVRYQVAKLAVRVQREVDDLLAVPDGAREVNRELLPAIDRGLREILGSVGEATAAEQTRGVESAAARRAREQLSEQVTTVFLQHAEFTGAVRDFYAYLGSVIARYDLAPAELAGFKNMLLKYVDLIVDDVLRHAAPIAASLTELGRVRGELLRLLGPAEAPGVSVERPPGRAEHDWTGLADWFIGRPGRPSEVAALRDATSRAITALLANVKRVTSAGVVDPGRRRDLIKLAGWFAAAEPGRAHALYAAAFGLYPARHLSVPAGDERLRAETPWREGAKASVPVNVRSRSATAARGRPARIVDDPLGERALVAEAVARERQRAAAVAELAAAASALDRATLSEDALDVLCELLGQATDARDRPDAAATAADPVHGLSLTLNPAPGRTARVGSALGTLVLEDAELVLDTGAAT